MKLALATAIVLFGGAALFLAAKHDLFNGKNWKPIDGARDAGVYALALLCLTIAAAALFFYNG